MYVFVDVCEAYRVVKTLLMPIASSLLVKYITFITCEI